MLSVRTAADAAGRPPWETVYWPGGRLGNSYRPVAPVTAVSPPGTSAAVSGRARAVPAKAVPLTVTGTPAMPASAASNPPLRLRSANTVPNTRVGVTTAKL